jgi:hypothetical protein
MCLACDNLCCISAATAQCGCNECPEAACHDTSSDEPEEKDPPSGDEPSPMHFRRSSTLAIHESGRMQPALPPHRAL